MVFEFLQWRPKFKTFKRGVKRGDLLFKRPRPYLNLASKGGWGKFFAYLVGGWFVTGLIGAVVVLAIAAATGVSWWSISIWAFAFCIAWVIFCILHLIHSLRFIRIAKLTDVEFVPLEKAEAIGKRLMTMPSDLPATDYNILYSRYIWADVEREPYRDVTEWVETIGAAQTGGLGAKYSESRLKEIEDMAGGIPSPQEIVRILQTELVPKYREQLGERLMMLYLIFLCTQPPTLPFDESTSRSEMREVASASDTMEVLEYLKRFA